MQQRFPTSLFSLIKSCGTVCVVCNLRISSLLPSVFIRGWLRKSRKKFSLNPVEGIK